VISYIKGTLAEKMEGAAVVEAGSIGYRIFMPASALELLGAVGDEVVVYTYFQVREDAMSLYGFLSRQDREMFKQLIGVNGIGPKAALGLLGTLRPDDLRLAILTGDAKAISRAPGIGAKTAQRIILDLKFRQRQPPGAFPRRRPSSAQRRPGRLWTLWWPLDILIWKLPGQ